MLTLCWFANSRVCLKFFFLNIYVAHMGLYIFFADIIATNLQANVDITTTQFLPLPTPSFLSRIYRKYYLCCQIYWALLSWMFQYLFNLSSSSVKLIWLNALLSLQCNKNSSLVVEKVKGSNFISNRLITSDGYYCIL